MVSDFIKTTAEDPTVRRIAQWLDICDSLHGHKCKPSTGSENKPIDGLRFVDVEQNCLVDDLKSWPVFIALSYVWGTKPAMRLRRDMLPKLKSPGSIAAIWHELPPTIKDSITVCRTIGFRYLWVDSICILVDDHQDRKNQIRHMNMVYTCASLTIAAASGSDCYHGLDGISQPRLPQKALRVRVQEKRDIELISLQRHPADVFSSSPWTKRAWTLQELVLSRRLLIFTETQIIFSCSQMFLTEKQAVEEIVRQPHFQPMDIRASLDCLDRICDLVSPTNTITKDYRGKNLKTFWYILSDYLRRNLTDPADTLNAYSGIINAFRPTLGEFCYGLPESNIISSLTWQYNTGEGPLRRLENLPSWSWSGWWINVENHSYWAFLRALFTPDPAYCTLRTGYSLRCIAVSGALQCDRHIPPTTKENDILLQALHALDSETPTSHLLIVTTEIAMIAVTRSGEGAELHDYARSTEKLVFPELEPRLDRWHGQLILDKAWREDQPDALYFTSVCGTDENSHDMVVMLVEFVQGIAYRSGLCTILKEQWRSVGPTEGVIALA